MQPAATAAPELHWKAGGGHASVQKASTVKSEQETPPCFWFSLTSGFFVPLQFMRHQRQNFPVWMRLTAALLGFLFPREALVPRLRGELR